MITPFINKFLYVDWVEQINGWGVFTKEDIQTETILETCPALVYPLLDALSIVSWDMENGKDSLMSLGLYLYSLHWEESYVAIPLGWGGLYNHSDKNNAQFVADKSNGVIHIMSLRDIKAGEQVLVSYGPTWFNDKPFPKVDL